MTIIKDVVNLWKAEDLLSQAWNRSYEMMELSREIFNQAVIYLRNGENIETLKALKKRDREINAFQQEVRRKVLTHFSVKRNNENIASGLNLIDIVVDAERIGDYCKNISDLSLLLDSELNCEPISDQIQKIEESVSLRFDKTLEAIEKQDELLAKNRTKRKRSKRITSKI